MKSYLAGTNREEFWRRFAFHSYYDSEATLAFPDLMDAYCRSTLRAMLVTPDMASLRHLVNEMAAGDDSYSVAVFPRWPRFLWGCRIWPKRTALIMIPKNGINKLAGTVQNFFVGFNSGRVAFRPDGVEMVLYKGSSQGPENENT